MTKAPLNEPTRLDDAARAGWLYFIAGNTQDDIARKLGVSRQTAQRLVSLAISQKLVKVTLEHPIAHCLELARELTHRHGLAFCDVVPSDPDAPETPFGVAHATARAMQQWLASERPVIVALGTGRTMRAAVEQLPTMNCPQHKLVSLVGNIAADGSGSFYDVISRMAVAVNAPHYPMTLPVVARSAEERRILSRLATVETVLALAARADVAFVGVGHIGEGAPLLEDGFISRCEMTALVRDGAVGEIVGWIFGADGRLLECPINERVSSARIAPPSKRLMIGAAAGRLKLPAIAAALEGGLLQGLVTNEATAEALLRRTDTFGD